MVKAKTQEAAGVRSPRKRRLRGADASDGDTDIIEDTVIETSRDSVEVDDEIGMNPADDTKESISNSPKDLHLKPERWKYKTRKKRKKSDETSDDVKDDDERVEIEDSNTVELETIRRKYIKMSKSARQSEYGKELYSRISSNCNNCSNCTKCTNIPGPRGMDSTGNSENQSSSDDAKRKTIPTWKVKTATTDCDVCGKEMLRSRIKKHMKIAHKSKKLYPCDECSFNAENLIELKKHLRKRHKLSIGTVRKMIKIMKLNRKHRRSVLEDEEPEPMVLKNRRLTGLGDSVKDELHQTSESDMERRTRGGTRTNYKEVSLDDDDWKAVLADTDSESNDDDDVEENKAEDDDKDDDSHDSGRETQSQTEQSADEGEKTKDEDDTNDDQEATAAVVDVEAALEELLSSMRTLSKDEMSGPGERYYSKDQKDLLFSYFHISDHLLNNDHREILSQKTGIEPRRVYFWFDNTRRIYSNKKKKESVPAPVSSAPLAERRSRRPRAMSPEFVASSVSSTRESQYLGRGSTVVEYDESKIVKCDESLEEVTESGEAVVIGVDINPNNCRCLLCHYSCSFRGNLYKHLRQAHQLEPKCCTLPRDKSELGAEAKGCRKTFTIESFETHVCNDSVPKCFGDELKIDRRRKTGFATSGYSSGESDEETGRSVEVVENMKKEGRAVILGWEMNDSCTKCLLCEVSMPCRGNLYKHINSHGYSVKFCCNPRDKSDLSPGNKGCRKIFLEETFDLHICNDDDPEQLGNFPLDKTVKMKKKMKRGGFRGYEKNFGTPDGSPAKFYNDRYTRLFHQLAVRTNIGVNLDTTFIRNGKMELCYLSDTQMSAVKDYLDDNDKFILVNISLHFQPVLTSITVILILHHE